MCLHAHVPSRANTTTPTSPSQGTPAPPLPAPLPHTRLCRCDKNMPGCLMAAVRHNRPTIIVYGGTIQPGVRHVDCPALGKKAGDNMTAVDAFESYGAFVTGKITEEERFDVVRHSCPGPGACGGMFTCVVCAATYGRATLSGV